MSVLGYYVEISDPFGVKLAQSDSFLRLEYARTVNDVGALTLSLDPDSDLSPYRLDGRIGVWRDTGAGYALDTGTIWLIRKWRRTLDADGERRLLVTAYSASELLMRRITAYAAGEPEVDKTDQFADDMIKEVVRENLGDLAVVDRDISAYFDVQEALSAGYVMSKAFSRRNMLTVLQEIADASTENGIPLFFDMITPSPGWLEFQTYIGQRGVDRTLSSASPLIMSPERGTIASGDLTDDYSGEISVVYAAGQGEGNARAVVELEDVAQVQASPFNRREYLRDARHISDASKLTYEAATALQERRPRRIFTGSLVDTIQVRYGRDWFWGDKVTVQFEGLSFDSYINAVHVQVDDGSEQIDASLRTEELL